GVAQMVRAWRFISSTRPRPSEHLAYSNQKPRADCKHTFICAVGNARVDYGKMMTATDFQKFLAQKLIELVAIQLHHERIYISDSSSHGIENKYPVSCAFEESPVLNFRRHHIP